MKTTISGCMCVCVCVCVCVRVIYRCRCPLMFVIPICRHPLRCMIPRYSSHYVLLLHLTTSFTFLLDSLHLFWSVSGSHLSYPDLPCQHNGCIHQIMSVLFILHALYCQYSRFKTDTHLFLPAYSIRNII